MSQKPYFREFDGWWYVQVRVGKKRRQIKLVKGRDKEQDAYREFCRVMAGGVGPVPEATGFLVVSVCDLFLEFSQKHHEAETYDWYKSFLQDFVGSYGRLCVADLKPFHVNRWLDLHDGWKDGGRRHAVICVKRAFSWAEGEGLIPLSPIKAVKKPSAKSRDRILTEDEKAILLGAIRDRQFKEFVIALIETGCRPSEVVRVTAADVNLDIGVWVLLKHKTGKKTRKPRVIYLTPTMVELSRKLMVEYPEGPMFRGFRKYAGQRKVWTRNGIRCRFKRLREKHPELKGVISYTLRHQYVTDALANGVPVATVAELVGHKDLKMIQSHYNHLSVKVTHLRDAAKKATGG